VDLLELFTVAGRLKSELRRGWVRKLGMERPESVADHSYRTALIAMVYSDLRGLDTVKVLRMALLHDLAEAIVGDSMPGERARTEKLRMESAAMRRTLAGLPRATRACYWNAWREFNHGTTPEARLVRQVDKLEMALQAGEYGKGRLRDRTREFFDSARAQVSDEDLLGVLRLVAPAP
jgi:putative hydrolase of HD superfamily